MTLTGRYAELLGARLCAHLATQFAHLGPERLQVAVDETVKWAMLAIDREDLFLACDGTVDDVWHACILETREYQAFCERLSPGRFLHHAGVAYEEYAAVKAPEALLDEDLSVLASYQASFGPFTAASLPHWVCAQRLAERHGWSLAALNEFLSGLAAAARELAPAPASPPLSRDDFLRDFHDRHAGEAGRYFLAAATETGVSPYEVLAGACAKGPRLATVLEIGCGSGELFEALARHGVAERYFGVDLSPGEVRVAAARIKDPRASFLTANARALPFRDGYFDLVCAHMTLHVIEPLEPVLAELRRVLNPGGRLVFLGPAGADQAFQEALSVFGRFDAVRGSPASGSARALRTPDLARQALLAAGFEPEGEVATTTVTNRGTPAELLAHFRVLYPYHLLAPAEQAEAEREIQAALARHADPSGTVSASRRLAVLAARRGVSP